MIQALVIALLVLLFLGAAIIILWLFFGDDGKPDHLDEWMRRFDAPRGAYDPWHRDLDRAGPDEEG